MSTFSLKNLVKIKKEQELSETKLGYLLALPSIIIICLIAIYPLFYTIWLTFNQVNLLDPGVKFIGFKQYIEILSSRDFWSSMWITLYFAFVSIILQISLGTAVAIFLNQKFKGRGFLRGIILASWAVPNVVNAQLWLWIFDANYGVLNRLLLKIGILSKGIVWLGTPFLALNMVILADTWRMLPLYVIMLLAALQTIPEYLSEAAVIDGAGPWRRFIHITFPLLRPMIFVILVLRTMDTIRVFDIIYIMTKGGPASSTMVISFYAYFTTFKYLNFGEGATIAAIVAMVILVISVVYMRILRSEDIY